MRPVRSVLAVVTCLSLALPARAGTLKCPADSVNVGNACINLYEASVWSIAPSNTGLVKLVEKGKATLADLTGGGATQLGCTFAPFSQTAYPANFPTDGNWTAVLGSDPPSPGVYAVSIPGVLPSTCISWFQAVQACAVSGERLARNEEWQRVAAGTPDPGTDDGSTDCNISSAGTPVNTGSRSKCKSSWGVFDMVGNVDEWVADWADANVGGFTDWTTSGGIAGGDHSAFGGPGGSGLPALPGALIRGGNWLNGTLDGVFAVDASHRPSFADEFIGFRCAR
jgi:formylglycine-generating enzyme required for sulfatase activity